MSEQTKLLLFVDYPALKEEKVSCCVNHLHKGAVGFKSELMDNSL
jgi:hypothetical protein